jgi:hypothetical protein
VRISSIKEGNNSIKKKKKKEKLIKEKCKGSCKQVELETSLTR